MEKALHTSAKHYAFSVSYGTYILGRLLQLEPSLFSTNIFNGSIVCTPYPWLPPHDRKLIPSLHRKNQNGPSRGTLREISLGLTNLPIAIATNCRSSPTCRSWGLDSLTTFVQGLSRNLTNPCFDVFVSALKLEGSSPSEIYNTLAFMLINSVPSPGVLPQRILQKQEVGVQEGIETSLKYWIGERNNTAEEIVLDYRVFVWVSHLKPIIKPRWSLKLTTFITGIDKPFRAMYPPITPSIPNAPVSSLHSDPIQHNLHLCRPLLLPNKSEPNPKRPHHFLGIRLSRLDRRYPRGGSDVLLDSPDRCFIRCC